MLCRFRCYATPRSENLPDALPSSPSRHPLPRRPVFPLADPALLPRNLLPPLIKPPRLPYLALCIHLPLSRPLPLFHSRLLRRRPIPLPFLHRPLIWSEPGICGWEERAKTVGKGLEGHGEGSEVEGDVLGAVISLPEQKRLIRPRFR